MPYIDDNACVECGGWGGTILASGKVVCSKCGALIGHYENKGPIGLGEFIRYDGTTVPKERPTVSETFAELRTMLGPETMARLDEIARVMAIEGSYIEYTGEWGDG